MIEGFYHDCSLLFDDDERVYLIYGSTEIHLIELKVDLTSPKPGGINRIIVRDTEPHNLGYSLVLQFNKNLLEQGMSDLIKINTINRGKKLLNDITYNVVLDSQIGVILADLQELCKKHPDGSALKQLILGKFVVRCVNAYRVQY